MTPTLARGQITLLRGLKMDEYFIKTEEGDFIDKLCEVINPQQVVIPWEKDGCTSTWW